MFSLVIPIYNEAKLIDELISRSVRGIEAFTVDYELILVDDGSTDESASEIHKWRLRNRKVKLLSLSRNFGHQVALTAGLEHSSGDIVAMMDGDLQDPPEMLREMYHKINGGDFDIVIGKRAGRKGNKGRNLSSFLFHLLFRMTGGVSTMDNHGNFSMMRRIAVEALLSVKEKARYLPGLISHIGYRHGDIEYVRDDRFRGKSKMSMGKLFALAADAIFSFSRFPARLCLVAGIAGIIVSVAVGICLLTMKARGDDLLTWSVLLPALFFTGSIQLLLLVIIVEYSFRSYKESRDRPLYFVRKFYNDDQVK
jgi:dolichol-phosphate mannosyltransferase